MFTKTGAHFFRPGGEGPRGGPISGSAMIFPRFFKKVLAKREIL